MPEFSGFFNGSLKDSFELSTRNFIASLRFQGSSYDGVLLTA